MKTAMWYCLSRNAKFLTVRRFFNRASFSRRFYLITIMNKKNIFYWALYGFAKDIVIVAFALYFSQWLVVQNGVSDIWYNLIFVGASILLICSAPVFAIV